VDLGSNVPESTEVEVGVANSPIPHAGAGGRREELVERLQRAFKIGVELCAAQARTGQ